MHNPLERERCLCREEDQEEGDAMKDALEGKVFDYPVKGFRNRGMTRLLFCTVNSDRSKYTPEEVWAAQRSTPNEGLEYTYNIINRLDANISKIFGRHGTFASKEAQSSGHSAPHLIFVLDEPVTVERNTLRKVMYGKC